MLTLSVKFKGASKIVQVRGVHAHAVEDGPRGQLLLAKDGSGNLVAEFNLDELAGWWAEHDTATESLAERMRKAQERVERLEKERRVGGQPPEG